MPMAVTPDHRFLYAALRSHSFPVSSFAIDPTSGRLTHLATTPLQDSMAYIVTDRTGRHLLGAS
jgi:6-phosphogluconolactonase